MMTSVLKAECIRLRIEERRSLREIHTLTGVSKGSLSAWLRPHPLTEVEKAARVQHVMPPRRPPRDRSPESELSKIVRGNTLNGQQVAKVSETAILLRMLAQGFNPFGSVFDGDRADWLVEVPDSGRIWKVQVKTAIHGRGAPTVPLRRGHTSKSGPSRYVKGDFDFIVGFDLHADRAYVWSWAEVQQRRCAVSTCPEACERWDKFKNG